MSLVDARLRPGPQRQNDRRALVDHKAFEVCVICFESESIFLPWTSLQVRELLAKLNSTDIEDSLGPTPKEVVSIDGITCGCH